MRVDVKAFPNEDRKVGYFKNMGEAISQALASIFGLNANLTLSAYCGYWESIGDRRGKVMAPIINFFLGKGHCKRTWENVT